MRRLTVTTGPAAGRTVDVVGDVVIGRENADLTIPDEEMSRRHAAVRPSDGGVVIEDLGSTNGTFVDGRRIAAPVTVATGVTIALGTSQVRLEVTPDSATRVSETPVAAVAQPTRVTGAAAPAAAAPAAADAPAPPAAAPPAEPVAGPADGGGPAAPPARRRRLSPRLLIVLAVAVLAIAVGLGVLLLAGDPDAKESHTLRAQLTTIPLAPPTSFVVSGPFNGEPFGKVAAVVQRRIGGQAQPGGPPAPLTGFILLTTPDGNVSLHLRGTIQVNKDGGEVVQAQGPVANGTQTYEGIEGTYKLQGGRPTGRTEDAHYRITGKVEY
ncbi:MAG TPA: FHA domain-containing protein [Thermoleophilaceae bacterium]